MRTKFNGLVVETVNLLLLQVKEIHVQVGDSVGEDDVILEFYPEATNQTLASQ